MKLRSAKHEIRILMTALNPCFTNMIMARIADREDLFDTPEGLELYRRMRVLLRTSQSGELPLRVDMTEDPVLSDDATTILKSKAKAYREITNVDHIIQYLETLEVYRNRRVVNDATEEIVDEIERSDPDLERVYGSMENALQSRTTAIVDDNVLDFGHGADTSYADELFNQVITCVKPDVIPSGFDNFDSLAGGFNRDDVVIIGAQRGGGKTMMMRQLADNFYSKFNLNVAVVSLEMGPDRYLDRQLASLSGIDSNRLRLRRNLKPGEIKRLKKAYKRFKQHGIKHKCRYRVFSLAEATPSAIDTMVGPMGYDVVLVDYLNRMRGAPAGVPAHEHLQEMTNQIKTIAKNRKILFVVLVQLTDDMRVSYSRAVENHVDWIWGWRMTDKCKELGVVPIEQLKVRHAEAFTFLLGIDLKTATWSDYVGDNPFSDNSSSGRGRGTSRRSSAGGLRRNRNTKRR